MKTNQSIDQSMIRWGKDSMFVTLFNNWNKDYNNHHQIADNISTRNLLWRGRSSRVGAVDLAHEAHLCAAVDVVPTCGIRRCELEDMGAGFLTAPEVWLSGTPVAVAHLRHGTCRLLPDERRVAVLAEIYSDSPKTVHCLFLNYRVSNVSRFKNILAWWWWWRW